MIDLRGLGYVVVDATDLDSWRGLAVDAFGLMAAAGPPGAPDDGTLWLRLDERSWRVGIRPAAADALAVAGWEVADRSAFQAAVAHLEAHGIALKAGDADATAARGVQELAAFDDPFGNHHEVYWGQTVEEEPFASPGGISGFLTDGVGIGHVLYVVPSAAEAEAFFGDAMGFRLTDRFAWGPNGAVFMHTTPRHHSLAFIDLPLPAGPGLNHVMLEVDRFEDLGQAYDRTIELKVPIVNSLGQHSNDPMLSYYVQTPSGFNVELGWNGLMIDEATWVATTWTSRGELWGHRGDFMDSVADAKVDG